MIRSLRASFLSRALREKLLVVAFLAIGVAWWGSAEVTRINRFWREQRTTTRNLAEQTLWIKNKAVIEETAQKTAGRFDQARTLNANQLQATIAQLLNEAGLKNNSSSPLPETRTDQFAVHEVEFRINNIEWGALTKFYESLQKYAPYIGVEKFILSSMPNNEAVLVLSLKVVSVEIMR